MRAGQSARDGDAGVTRERHGLSVPQHGQQSARSQADAGLGEVLAQMIETLFWFYVSSVFRRLPLRPRG